MSRQKSPTLGGIRRDHLERYYFAMRAGSPVLDAACGIGYGAYLLSTNGLEVTGVDISEEAIRTAIQFYDTENVIRWIRGDLTKRPWGDETFQTVVSFETLEHLDHPETALKVFRESLRPGGKLYCSVPNEEKYPFDPEKFAGDEYPHKRHYTPQEFSDLLWDNGFDAIWRGTQVTKSSPVQHGTGGLFLVYECALRSI